jgi:hypothetical protein
MQPQGSTNQNQVPWDPRAALKLLGLPLAAESTGKPHSWAGSSGRRKPNATQSSAGR